MEKRLQLNQNSKIKKELNKLSLELKFSQINSTWFEKTQRKMIPTKQSPMNKHFYEQTDHDYQKQQQDHQQRIQTLQQKLQKHQHQIEKHSKIMTKFLQIQKQRLQQLASHSTNRQKHMRQLTIRRGLLINSIKKQMRLFMKMSQQHDQQILKCLQEQYEREVNMLMVQLRRNKRQWRERLRNILTKYEYDGGNEDNPNANNQITTNYNNNNIISLKQLQQQAITTLHNSNKKHFQLSNQLITLKHQYETKLQQLTQHLKNKYKSITQQIHILQKMINQQLLNQQLQYEQNRQRLLLVFEEYGQRMVNQKQENNNNKQLKQKQQMIKVVNKNNLINYRHQQMQLQKRKNNKL